MLNVGRKWRRTMERGRLSVPVFFASSEIHEWEEEEKMQAGNAENRGLKE